MEHEDQLADLLLDWEERFDRGENVPPEELCRGRPELVEPVRKRVAALKEMRWVNQQPRDSGEEQVDSGIDENETASGGTGTVSPQAGDEPIPGYRLVKSLGKGAFGEVWLAENLGRHYAVKFIHAGKDWSNGSRHLTLEKEGLDRIKWVNHAFILHRHTHRSNGSELVLLTELADASLDELFDKVRKDTPKLPLYAHALCLLRDAADALDHLQANSLMHLDVKPANLLLVKGRCKLGDFGTVRAIRPGQRIQGSVALSMPSSANPEESTTVHFPSIQDVPWSSVGFGGTLFTNTGAFTIKYAPPEAFLGKFSRSFDHYSLALTYCELVAGVIPFRERGTDILKERMAGTMELGCLPEELRPVVAKALSPSPNERYQTCLTFIEALRHALRPLIKGNRKANKWLDRWSAVENDSAHPLLSQASLSEQRHEAVLFPESLLAFRLAEQRRRRRQRKTAERGAGTILGLVFSPLRLFDHLGQVAGHWLRRKWKMTGPEIEVVLRLVLLLGLSLAVPAILKVCVDRTRPLVTLPCWQGEERGATSPVNTSEPPAAQSEEPTKKTGAMR